MENNVHTDIELFAKAKEQEEASKKELANFLVSRSSKSLQDLLLSAWRMEFSIATLARKATTWMEVVRKYATENLMEGCNGE